MPTGYVDGRFESSFPLNENGTGPFSTKQIYFPALSFQPTLGPSHLMRDDEMRNQDEPLAVTPEAYDPAWSIASRTYPDTAGFLLTMCLGLPTSSQGTNAGALTNLFGTVVPGGCFRHRWTAPFGPTGASPYSATFRASYKDQTVFYKLQGAGASQLTIDTPEKGGSKISAQGPALYMVRTTDPALSPSYEALTIPPFERSHLTLPGWLTSTSTTEDFNIQIDNPMEPWRSLGIASKFPDVLEKADTPVTFTGSIPKRQLGTADYDTLLNATGFPGTATWINTASIGTTAFKYQITMGFANLQYIGGGPNALENTRRIGQDLSFKATYAGASSVTVEIVNATTAYT